MGVCVCVEEGTGGPGGRQGWRLKVNRLHVSDLETFLCWIGQLGHPALLWATFLNPNQLCKRRVGCNKLQTAVSVESSDQN